MPSTAKLADGMKVVETVWVSSSSTRSMPPFVS